MKPTIYVETTIPSYLTARPSRDLIIAAHQSVTRTWWESQRTEFELFVSLNVLTEAGAGDPGAAEERLNALAGIPLLEVTEEAIRLADRFVHDVPMPPKAAIDALHVAIASVHGMDYLLTWNCTHIANARLRPMLESICIAAGRVCPVICTPLELSEIES